MSQRMSETKSISTTVANGGPFVISMEHENLCVVSITTENVPTFAWWLFREYSLDRRTKGSFHSILMEDDGVSIVCSTLSAATLEAIGTGLCVSPQRWRAFVIKVVGAAVELPGAVHYLADSLSKEGLSILHISTFESEVFLVQEQDIEKACSVFRKSAGPQELASFILEAQRKRTSSGNGEIQESTADSYFIADNSDAVSSNAPFKDGFELCVFPSHVMLAKLNEDFKLSDCSSILTKLLLYDDRYSPLERMVTKGVPLPKAPSPIGSSSSLRLGLGSGESVSNMSLSQSRSRSSSDFVDTSPSVENQNDDDKSEKVVDGRKLIQNAKNSFMWGMWQCENELTLLLDESDVDRFPEGALTVSPQRWRLIKLGGRMIEFDETGIVTAMSKIDSSIPSLNISTATTNCTLVPEELLEQTLDCLSESLGCPVRPYR